MGRRRLARGADVSGAHKFRGVFVVNEWPIGGDDGTHCITAAPVPRCPICGGVTRRVNGACQSARDQRRDCPACGSVCEVAWTVALAP